MRINVTVDRLVIKGAKGVPVQDYGASFISALESRLSRAMGEQAISGTRIIAQTRPMRVQAGAGAHAAGAATARAIGGALGGETSR